MPVTSIQPDSSLLVLEGNGLGVNEMGPSAIPGLKETTNFRPRYAKQQPKKKGLIAKFFSNMSRLGMSYDEDVIKNMRAMPADKSLLPKDERLAHQDLIQMANSQWKVKSNADKNFYEKDYPQKVVALRKLAMQPELEQILTTMANEAIVYDTDLTYFCTPFIEPGELADLKKKDRDNINKELSTYFRRFYKMLNWKYKAWDDFYKWLVEGLLAYEIVWDSLEKPTKIIGLVPLDPASLTRKYEQNKIYWIQYDGVQGKERKLLDSQVVYIAYQESNSVSRTSYLERLVRPFNIYRIIEQAYVIWTVTNAQSKMKFTIPTRGMNKPTGMQTLASAMNRYKEDIKFVGDTGELTINGQVTMPFNKEYWFPENESGTPQVESIGNDGPDLNDSDQLKYFKNQLLRTSFIPLSRFDAESGETWFGADATATARDEINFGRYVGRMRNIYSQIMIKPLQLQMACSHPELQDNRELLEAISLQYNSYNLFEEMLEIEYMQKKVDFIQTMKDSLIDEDPATGNQFRYFSSEWLVERYLKLSKADIDLNNKLKKEETEKWTEMSKEAADAQGDDM